MLVIVSLSLKMNQWTAVFFAVQAKHHDVMKYLLDTKRVELNHKDVVRFYLLAAILKCQ